ncbi:MAG: hypothetical protein RL685_2978 [Pseudomonadota bacterium]|jgi:tetratricopeptide (TPR) repeat protein
MKSDLVRAPLGLSVRRSLAALLVGWLGVFGAARCWAADGDPERAASALELGKQGAVAYESAQYAEAIASFDRAFALLPAPSLQLWAARSCAQLGRLVEAQQRYREIASLSDQIGDPVVQRGAQLEAKKELAELTGRIPLLEVSVLGTAGRPARLTLDARPFESEPGQHIPVDPGHHVLVGTYQEQRVSLAVDLELGERRELVLEFPALAASVTPPTSFDPVDEPRRTPASSASAWRTAGWVGIGAGGAVLLTGIITRVVAQGRYDTLQRQPGCTRTQCPAGARERIDSYNSMRSVSLLTTISGAVLGAAGVGVLLFVSKEDDPTFLARSSLALSAEALSFESPSPLALTWSGSF